jgi:UDP-glucose 4-epimerase
MRVLVTGGAGYIGSITVRALLDAGHEVVVLDTLEKGRREAVDPRATFVLGDVGDADVVRGALAGVDTVMHLAGFIEVAESQADPARYFDNNVTRPLVMLDEMREAGVAAIVFSSTAAVYGEPASVPILEDAPTVPVNAYGESKLAFEHELDTAAAAWGLRSVRLRYFNVAGALPDAERRFEVYGNDYPTADGTCVRDYIHVCDLARAHVLALEHLHAGGRGSVCNLGNGRGYSNLEVVQACAEASDTRIDVVFGPRRAGDPAVLVASAERALALLGWKPGRGELAAMVADAWRWHQSRMR